MPKVLIDNKQACSSRQNKIFIVCMIHSNRKNFIRRKTMRDTWLSQNKIQLFDLIDKRDQNEKLIPREFQNLEMVHLFIVGSGKYNRFEFFKIISKLFLIILFASYSWQ